MPASALAFGAVQYDKLKSSTFEGGGGVSGAAPPTGINAAPSSSLISPLSAGEANAAIATSAAPTKAYVVQNDVSSQSALERNIASTSNF